MRLAGITSLALSVFLAVAVIPLGGCGGGAPGTGTDSLISHGDANGYAYIPSRVAAAAGGRQTGVTVTSVPLTASEQAERELAPASGSDVRTDTGQAFKTTSTGAYYLKGVPKGTRTLAFSDSTGSLGTVSVTVAGGETTSGLAPSATPSNAPGCLIGYLLRDAGPKGSSEGGVFYGVPSYNPDLAPAGGATVTAGSYSAVTEDDGFFEIYPVTPGDYIVTTAGRTVGVAVTVEGGSCTVVQDVSTMEDTGGVVGRVLRVDGISGPKLALLGTTSAEQVSGTPEPDALVVLDTGHVVATDASGSFAMVGVPAGYHFAWAMTDEDAAEALEGWAEVQVDAGVERPMRYFPESRMGSVVVEPGRTSLSIEVGDTVCLGADAYDTDANQIRDFTSFTWASGNPAVLAVDFDGEIEGLATGTTTVTASYGGVSSAAFAVTVGAPGTVEKRGGVLTYWSDDQIATMTGDGIDRAIHFDVYDYGFSDLSAPALSPDGTMVAFAGELSGYDADLYLYELGADGATRLTSTPNAYEFSPAWAPDGSGFYYDRDGDIYFWDLAAGTATAITDTPFMYETAPYPSPDGTMLVYTEILDVEAEARHSVRARQEGDVEESVVAVCVLGDGTSTIVSPDDGNSYGYAEWSPDGVHLAYEDLTDGRIVIGAYTGGPVTTVATATSTEMLFEPTFSPGSDWVAFSVYSSDSDTYRIDVVRTTGADRGRVGHPGWDAFYPSWSDPPW